MIKKLKTITFLFFCISGLTLSAYAQQKTHTVESGETLFSIAQQYSVTVQNLREWNDLANNQLTIGQTLIVQSDDQESAVNHTVVPQETLFSISKQYAVSIAEIKSWNNLSGNNLNVGQELVIYPGSNASNNAESQSGNSIVVSSNTQQNTYYTVKSGDTLYKIARGHNMTLEELKELNDLSSNTISIGQQLTVRARSAPPSVAESSEESSPQGKFVTYRISERQNLENILNKFQMDEEEFRALNPDISSTTFQIGQKVTVLAPATKTYDNPYKTGAGLKNLGETPVSRYSDSEKGQTTTSGELFVPNELTAAHSNISLGTIIYIENPVSGKGIYVRINDRISSNGIKLSEAAWQALNFSGSAPSVKIYQDQ